MSVLDRFRRKPRLTQEPQLIPRDLVGPGGKALITREAYQLSLQTRPETKYLDVIASLQPTIAAVHEVTPLGIRPVPGGAIVGFDTNAVSAAGSPLTLTIPGRKGLQWAVYYYTMNCAGDFEFNIKDGADILEQVKGIKKNVGWGATLDMGRELRLPNWRDKSAITMTLTWGGSVDASGTIYAVGIPELR